jgi:hypothetical protein
MEIENQNQTIYKNKIHIDNFRIKHKEKIMKKIDCEICGGSFSYFNKSTHKKTIKCLKVKTLRGL